MRLILVILMVTCISNESLCQSLEEDEVNFQSAIDWLDSKLNYVYYDNSNGRWWKNTFYVNEEKVITIKHISSSRRNTANIKDKDYTIRSFRIQDIDPNSLKVTDIKNTSGRIVKGKRLELRTFGFQNLIGKTINSRKGSNTSFLFLSFPEVLNDSILNYADVVKEKFAEAIVASTHIYPLGTDDDIQQVLKVLVGDFISGAGQTWTGTLVQPNVIQVETGDGNITYLGYDTSLSSFYWLSISSDGIQTKYFKLVDHPMLTIKQQSGDLQIQIESINAFQFGDVKYYRK